MAAPDLIIVLNYPFACIYGRNHWASSTSLSVIFLGWNSGFCLLLVFISSLHSSWFLVDFYNNLLRKSVYWMEQTVWYTNNSLYIREARLTAPAALHTWAKGNSTVNRRLTLTKLTIHSFPVSFSTIFVVHSQSRNNIIFYFHMNWVTKWLLAWKMESVSWVQILAESSAFTFTQTHWERQEFISSSFS